MGSLVKGGAGLFVGEGVTLEATGKSALHLVSAWSTQNHLALAEVATEEKSNEITAIPKLLESLDLNGATITIAAKAGRLAVHFLTADQISATS